MDSLEAITLIKEKINTIKNYLLEEYNIELEILKEINFGIKIRLSTNMKIIAITNIYNGKKGFRINEDKGKLFDEKLYNIFKESFNNYNNIVANKNLKIDNVNEVYLNKIYKCLKEYENENIDFSIFADELLKISNNTYKEIINKNKNNFMVLEKIYIELKG